ncbi:MAG: DUF4857 domain-containing protein [Desulfovibrionaceae bacterium]|nr:DUF4857 domain-containing protein [Desulfovibrionaceae bacterium]
MRKVAYAALMLFSILVLSLALPAAYDLIFIKPIQKTNLFFSPVLKKCIFTEQIRGFDAKAAAKSEGHHADIVYKDESGEYYDRLAFEAYLPFIYYRNMELRGLLPVTAYGQSFDRKTIEKHRRVLELKATSLDSHRPKPSCLPLIEADPGQVALLYPDDRFQSTTKGLQFINADFNAPDEKLSKLFTLALTNQGFVFPCKHIGGNFTNFKPYEGGIFLVDAKGQLFHLMRQKGEPFCTKVALPKGVVPRHVLVSEARERQWLGLVLDTQDRIWLLRQHDLALIGLETTRYRPNEMDFKLIFNPLFVTAIFSDAKKIYAQVFKLPVKDAVPFSIAQPFHSFSMSMSRSQECWQTMVAASIFPFVTTLQAENTSLLTARITSSSHYFSLSLPICLLLAIGYFFYSRRKKSPNRLAWTQIGLIAFCGIYALIPILLLDENS